MSTRDLSHESLSMVFVDGKVAFDADQTLRLECARLAAQTLSGYTSGIVTDKVAVELAAQYETYIKTGQK